MPRAGWTFNGANGETQVDRLGKQEQRTNGTTKKAVKQRKTNNKIINAAKRGNN